jgi:hypothetical protein
MHKVPRILLTFAILLMTGSAFAQANRYVVGILPVDDESAETLTETLPTGLTMLLYNHIREMPNMEPILLAPGGLYDPGSKDWIQEYGRKSHVDAMLISRLLPTLKVNDRRRRLVFAIEIMDVKTGNVSARLVDDTVEIQTSDLAMTVANGYISADERASLVASFFKNSADFEKMRIGTASLKLVDWTKSQLQSGLPALGASPSGTAADAKTPPCPMTFRIRFMTKHSIAKGYVLLANDTDQSTAINDGIASFAVPGGPLVIRAQIPDPPYGIPLSKLYQASTLHTCSSQPQSLTMEIGAAGEALLRWE